MNSLLRKGQVKFSKPWHLIGATLLLLLVGQLQAQDFTYTNTNGTITITGYTGPGGNVTIPSTIAGTPVTAIGGQAFWGVAGLTDITIPDSVTNIEDGVGSKGGALGAFAWCSALTNVNMGNGVIYMGMGTFALCNGLTQIRIPDSVRTVGDFAFHGCLSLTDITIGRNVTQLGPGLGYVFDGSTNLTRILIPGNVTNVGPYAFAYDPSLACVTIEEGVTHLGRQSFHFCESLTNITLPATVTAIDNWAFAYCNNLAGVFFKGNAPTATGDGLFANSTNVIVYYLPGTSGWGPTFAGQPTMLWNAQPQTSDGSLGITQNRFGFNIAGTPDIPLVVEGSADIAAPSWLRLQTCTLTNGSIYFSDPQWTNYPRRFYRIRSPGEALPCSQTP